jgi:peptide/nickel transport system permease protein
VLIYTARRILYAIPIAIAVSIVCFMLVHIAPGDPISAIVPPDAPPAAVAQVRADYGLDRPLPVQYGLWLNHIVHGDFGTSIAKGRPVLPDLIVSSKKTLILAITAAAIGFLLGGLLGGTAAAFHGTWIDRAAVMIGVAGVSVPHYWLGMVLVIVFSVQLHTLPAMGAGPGADWIWDWDHIRYLILPAITLSVIPAGLVARTVRGVVIEILNQDYISTLRSKGLPKRRIFAHVLKNAAPTTLAVMGLQLGYLMGGSILVEYVFNWPGTGMMLNEAILDRDLPVLQGTTLVLAMFFVALNLIVDLIQTMIDPRIRRT